MLRIDVNGTQAGFQYRMPPDNPYVGRTGYDEIFSIGLRNPWRFSFDKRWGVLFIADVGQDAHEEVNRATPWDENLGRGYNYGWKRLEGYHCFVPGCSSRGTVLPLLEYRHSVTGEDNCSITGGYVYRGQAYPALYGAYLFGDLCSGRIWGVWVSAAKPASARTLLDTSLTISSFGEAEDGTVFVVDYAGGRYYRIVGTAR
jgi:glucose/arabinose dehydrogenase